MEMGPRKHTGEQGRLTSLSEMEALLAQPLPEVTLLQPEVRGIATVLGAMVRDEIDTLLGERLQGEVTDAMRNPIIIQKDAAVIAPELPESDIQISHWVRTRDSLGRLSHVDLRTYNYTPDGIFLLSQPRGYHSQSDIPARSLTSVFREATPDDLVQLYRSLHDATIPQG